MSYRVQWELGEKENAPIVELVRITDREHPCFTELGYERRASKVRLLARDRSVINNYCRCYSSTKTDAITASVLPSAWRRALCLYCVLMQPRVDVCTWRKTVLQEKKKNSLNFCNVFFFNLPYCIV